MHLFTIFCYLYYFHYRLSVAWLNAYAMYKTPLQDKMVEGELLSHAQFKRKLAEQLSVGDIQPKDGNTTSI